MIEIPEFVANAIMAIQAAGLKDRKGIHRSNKYALYLSEAVEENYIDFYSSVYNDISNIPNTRQPHLSVAANRVVCSTLCKWEKKHGKNPMLTSCKIAVVKLTAKRFEAALKAEYEKCEK